MHPCTYPATPVIIICYRVHSWVKLLITSPPPVPYIVHSNKSKPAKKLLGQYHVDFFMSCSQCVVVSAIWSYNQILVLVGNQEQWHIASILFQGKRRGSSKTLSNSLRGSISHLVLGFLFGSPWLLRTYPLCKVTSIKHMNMYMCVCF